MPDLTIYRAEWLHDGLRLHRGAALMVAGGRVASVLRRGVRLPEGVQVHDLGAGGIAPGMVDLQVNGGGGVMLGAGADAAMIARITRAHGRLFQIPPGTRFEDIPDDWECPDCGIRKDSFTRLPD